MSIEFQRPEAVAPPILVRADAGAGVGMGHVMRCLAIAQAWRDRGGAVSLASNRLPKVIEARLAMEGIDLCPLAERAGDASDALRTTELAGAIGARWVILDGYDFTTTYRRTLRKSGLRILLLEDMPGDRDEADVILSPSGQEPLPSPQARAAACVCLSGPAYAPLRREFRVWRDRPRPVADTAMNILVTMGGADADNRTLLALEALEQLRRPDLQTRVVVGPANPHAAVLERMVEVASSSIRLEPPSESMPELIAWADLAVTAAGSTCWELAFMGVPMITIVLADNQEPIAKRLVDAGAAVSVGSAAACGPRALAATIQQTLSSHPKRERMSRCGRELVDGLGAERVVQELEAVPIEGRSAVR